MATTKQGKCLKYQSDSYTLKSGARAVTTRVGELGFRHVCSCGVCSRLREDFQKKQERKPTVRRKRALDALKKWLKLERALLRLEQDLEAAKRDAWEKYCELPKSQREPFDDGAFGIFRNHEETLKKIKEEV